MKKISHTNKYKKIFKIVALLLILVTSVLFFLFYRAFNTLKWGMSECLVWQSSSLSTRFIISQTEQDKITALTSDFANKIMIGKISLLKGFSVLRSFYKGPVFMALLNSSIQNQQTIFEQSYKTDYSSFENVPDHFFRQVMLDKIAPDSFSRVKKLLTTKRLYETKTSNGYVIPETIETFKKDISAVSFLKCLNIMKNTTNGEKIATSTTLFPVFELKKVIKNL